MYIFMIIIHTDACKVSFPKVHSFIMKFHFTRYRRIEIKGSFSRVDEVDNGGLHKKTIQTCLVVEKEEKD